MSDNREFYDLTFTVKISANSVRETISRCSLALASSYFPNYFPHIGGECVTVYQGDYVAYNEFRGVRFRDKKISIELRWLA